MFQDRPSQATLQHIAFALSGFNLIRDGKIRNWQWFFIHSCQSKLRNLITFSKEDKLIKSEESMKRMFLRFLFFSEFQINDGACIIHEGASILGRGKKCSSLIREFSVDGLFQYKVSCGNTRNMGYCICNKKKMSKSRNRSLTFQECRNLRENLEHDHMLFASHDRQSATFGNHIDDYKSQLEGSIDEYEYIRCKQHNTSELFDCTLKERCKWWDYWQVAYDPRV